MWVLCWRNELNELNNVDRLNIVLSPLFVNWFLRLFFFVKQFIIPPIRKQFVQLIEDVALRWIICQAGLTSMLLIIELTIWKDEIMLLSITAVVSITKPPICIIVFLSVPATPAARGGTRRSMIWKLESTHSPFTLGAKQQQQQQQQHNQTPQKGKQSEPC